MITPHQLIASYQHPSLAGGETPEQHDGTNHWVTRPPRCGCVHGDVNNRLTAKNGGAILKRKPC